MDRRRTSIDRRVDLEREARAAYLELRPRPLSSGAWDPAVEDTTPGGVMREFGPFRWIIVPLAVAAFAAFVWFVSALPGIFA